MTVDEDTPTLDQPNEVQLGEPYPEVRHIEGRHRRAMVECMMESEAAAVSIGQIARLEDDLCPTVSRSLSETRHSRKLIPLTLHLRGRPLTL